MCKQVKLEDAKQGVSYAGGWKLESLVIGFVVIAVVASSFLEKRSPIDQPLFAQVMGSTTCDARRRRGVRAAEPTESVDDTAASYSRYSSDGQREESITDQQRKCCEGAEGNNHRILPELEFSDEAVSGTKLHREGLDAMLRAAENGEFQVLYFHSLSRLARESVITMPMLKRLVYTYKVRIISVTEGIDSDRDGWEVIASIVSLMAEQYIRELSANVFRGQEGAVLDEYAVGDHCFGFTTVPIPGSENGRRGRNAKPRMRYVIDEVTAPWVVRMFRWFVIDEQSISWIVRELNRRGAPKDHRSSTPKWRHGQVAGRLASEKYTGIWPWGEMRNVRDPETGKIRQEPRCDEEVERWTRQFPHLRIIEDDIFDKAQELLEENYQKYAAQRDSRGRLNRTGRGSRDCPPRHLLSRLVKCDGCERFFVVGGSGGKYMFCPGRAMGECECQTQLRRDRAERMILDEVGKRILSSPVWVDAVYQSLLKSWHVRQQQVPSELAAIGRQLSDVEQRIQRILDRVEEGYDDPDLRRRLEERRGQRRDLRKRVRKLERANADLGPEPTREWLRQQLANLGENLHSRTPAAAYALRDLVGGEITVKEIRREGRERHYLQGRFTIRSVNVADVASGTTACEAVGDDDEIVEEIVIDFVDANPLDAEALEAKAPYDEGLMGIEIAEALGCSKSKVTKLLKHAHALLGEKMLDGRTRRATLKKKHRQPRLSERLTDRVMERFEAGLLIDEIAAELSCNRATVKKIIDRENERRGLPVPDGRSRRKTLDHKVCRPQQVGPSEEEVREECDEDDAT